MRSLWSLLIVFTLAPAECSLWSLLSALEFTLEPNGVPSAP